MPDTPGSEVSRHPVTALAVPVAVVVDRRTQEGVTWVAAPPVLGAARRKPHVAGVTNHLTIGDGAVGVGGLMESEMYGESPDEREERFELEGRCVHCEFTHEGRCSDCGGRACPGWTMDTATGKVPLCCDCGMERERWEQ